MESSHSRVLDTRLDPVDARVLDLDVERVAVQPAQRGAVAHDHDLGDGRQPRAQTRASGGRLAAHRDRRTVGALGPQSRPVRWGDERARNPGRTAAERGEQRRAVGVGVAAQRPLAEQVRSQQAERARVRQRRADPSADADPGRVTVEAADRRQAPAARQLVPAAQMMGGRPDGDGRLGVAQPTPGLRRRAPRLCGIGRQAPQFDAVAAVRDVECRPGVRQHDPARERRVEHVAAVRERVGGEADAACRAHRGRDLARRPPGVSDLLHDAEREVMALPGAHLRPHEQEHAVVRALPTVAPCAQRVVVGEQHRLGPRIARRVQQLGHGRRSVRVRRMHVDDARDVERDRRISHPAIFTPADILDGCPGASSVSSASRLRASWR